MTTLQLPLTNIQLEILKLYSTNLSERDLTDLRDLLAKFFAERSIRLANQIWEEKRLTQEDMDKWLNED